jgi:hypothetical protein
MSRGRERRSSIPPSQLDHDGRASLSGCAIVRISAAAIRPLPVAQTSAFSPAIRRRGRISRTGMSRKPRQPKMVYNIKTFAPNIPRYCDRGKVLCYRTMFYWSCYLRNKKPLPRSGEGFVNTTRKYIFAGSTSNGWWLSFPFPRRGYWLPAPAVCC